MRLGKRSMAGEVRVAKKLILKTERSVGVWMTLLRSRRRKTLRMLVPHQELGMPRRTCQTKRPERKCIRTHTSTAKMPPSTSTRGVGSRMLRCTPIPNSSIPTFLTTPPPKTQATSPAQLLHPTTHQTIPANPPTPLPPHPHPLLPALPAFPAPTGIATTAKNARARTVSIYNTIEMLEMMSFGARIVGVRNVRRLISRRRS